MLTRPSLHTPHTHSSALDESASWRLALNVFPFNRTPDLTGISFLAPNSLLLYAAGWMPAHYFSLGWVRGQCLIFPFSECR